MPVRIASLARQLDKNGQRLHRVIASRAFSHGADPCLLYTSDAADE